MHISEDDDPQDHRDLGAITVSLLGDDEVDPETRTAAQHLAHLPTLPLDEREDYWLKWVYQGDNMPQLSVRAILLGSFLGCLMSMSNLYVGLKTGWALGVAITACILSFGICKALGIKMSILEQNCMQSAASSAGYSTGGTMVSGVAAYLMITGHHMSPLVLTLWTFFLAALGVFVAIPMKRQMIDVEQLKFPSGVAAAETLRSLHTAGPEAAAKARVLGLAGVGSAIWKFLQEGLERIPGSLDFPGALQGIALSKWTISFDLSWVMLAAGAIIGWRIAWSLMFGAVVNYCFLAPWMVQLGDIPAEGLGYRAIVSWSTWAGVAIMVSSSLLMFLLQWKTVLRALSGITSVFSGPKADANHALEAIEVPSIWFLGGTLFAGTGCVAVLVFAFGTQFHIAVLSVLLSFVLCLVACRATGESDITPMGAMGKMAQLTFSVLAHGDKVTNLMTASVTAGAASSSADLLTDLKSGYLLGANPRKQFLAQFFGIFAGTIVVVPAFYVLVPDAASLGGVQWPAPAAQVWKSVAELLAQGIHALKPSQQAGLAFGLLAGLVLPTLEMILPKKLKPFVPSATGVGLAFVIPFFNSLSMFLGAVIAGLAYKFSKEKAELYTVPLSSGIIAGESLMGVAVALLKATHDLG